MTSPALDRPRVAELIVDLGAKRKRRGSGYLVSSGAVLTAAHVVEGARSVDVRFEPDLPGEWRATATAWWSDSGSDLAVVSIAPRADRQVPDARFARIADHPQVLEVQAVGFPRWKLRDDDRTGRTDRPADDGRTDRVGRTGRTASDPARNRTRYRDAYHAVGSAAVLSNWRAGSLEVTIPVAPAEGPRGGPSPWEGMSGAAVWAGDRIVGVISKHHPGDGLARLAAVRLDRALDGGLEPAQKSRLRALLALPVDADQLPLALPLPPPLPLPSPLPRTLGNGTSDRGPDEAFTVRYRRFMVGTLDRFDFFAVDPRGIPRRQPFTMGYVPLTLKRRDRADDGTVSVGARADRELRSHRRALIRGVAGAGKSTLVRWLGAVAAGGVGTERGVRTDQAYGPDDAARSVGADEFSAAPFLLELVRFANGRPPPLNELVAETLRPEMPDGWVRNMLAEGRVLLLLDGLDEVRPRERVHLEEWVDEQLVSYPDTRCIVTTRPSTVAEQWWVDRGFERFDLLPMSRHSVERYVRGWHRKARDDQPDTPGGTEVRKELERCEQGLLSTLSNRPALRGMSANPLLCGLLCALNLERGEHLPESRKQIYDAAVDLLLVRWPHLRRRHRAEVRTGRAADAAGMGPDGGDPPLRDEELLKLLQRLAFWLVTNRRLILDHDVAERRVAASLFGLRSGSESPRRTLEYLAHESGLLRELPDRSIEFVHRTFRDHLAAKEVVEEENLNLMLDNADKPHWHDVVVMVGAHARPSERTKVLLSLLDRGRTEPEHRDTLYLLAAAVLEQSAVLPLQDPNSPDVRALVEEAMAELIPPRTTAAADQLAAAGEFVLDLLPDPKGLPPERAALVVRAVARIAAQWNPPGAIDKILQFTAKPDNRSISELLETWGRFGDYEVYARDVLSEIDFSRFSVHLQNPRRIERIGHLKTITDLLIRNDVPDLTPLAGLPALRRLTLRDNGMTSLAQLENVRSLEVLILDRCSTRAATRPLDLSPLGRLRLRRLVVSGLTTPVDLTTLAGVELNSLRLSARPNGARTLPAELYVRHLSLVAGARGTGFAAVGGVRSVLLDWAPNATELAALAGMRELRRLILWRVPGTTPVPALPGVAVTICPAPMANGYPDM